MVESEQITLVMVTWHDAHAENSSWISVSELSPDPCVVLSVGILLPEAKPGHLVLAQSAHSYEDGIEQGSVDSVLCVPVEMVRSMTVLSRLDQSLL
jgi:hypothetical protein